jgi:hypothetical protein
MLRTPCGRTQTGVRLTAQLEDLEMWGKMLGVARVGKMLGVRSSWKDVGMRSSDGDVGMRSSDGDVGCGSNDGDVEKREILYINLENNYLLLES